MTWLPVEAANYFNKEIGAYIWPDKYGQPCAYCDNITVWTVVANRDQEYMGRKTTKCCSLACLEKYKAEYLISVLNTKQV